MSSIKSGLRRAGIVGLSTLVAGSMMTFSAVTAQATWATTGGGSIGIVDTQPVGAPDFLTGTQGAKLVLPNVAGQALGDIRLAVPNSFANGDTIDLAIFDRTATNTANGQINADAAHKLGFSGTPTVAVKPKPYIAATRVGPLSDTAGNTENAPVVATTAVAPLTVATQPPVFTTSLVASSRAGGIATDIIRLQINAVQATIGSDPAEKWIITVGGIKADLGAAVSPGELRVVPFAYNGTSAQTSATATALFGNLPGTPPALPTITQYTVPAYVSPVTFTIGSPSNIVADGTTQSVGDMTIAETNNYSLQNGTYTVNVGGATVMNTAANPLTVTGTGFTAPGETVTKTGADNVIQFTIAGALNTTKVSIKVSGLLLSDTTKGPISYTLSGGSINTPPNAFLVRAGTSGSVPAVFPIPPNVSGVNGVAADSAFGPTVNQLDIDAPPLTIAAVSTPIAFRIGGIDRYETAEKIALAGAFSQPTAIIASGELFPDALSSSYLASETGASILLTKHNVIPAVTLEGLRLLGVHTVYLIGGTGAINSAVEAQLRNTSQFYPGGEVTFGQGKLLVVRLGGSDRYATNKIVNLKASALSTDLNPVGRTSITFGQASKLTALVATGGNFPDALAGGPATHGNGSGNLPLILTPTSALTSSASSQLTALGIEQAVILGKEGAVSAAVESSITGMGVASKRIGGADRYETATLVADFEIAGKVPTSTVTGGLGFIANRVFLARGDDFPDALAGGPLAGGLEAPIVLTNPNTLTPVTKTWLTANAARLNFATALGLGGAVSPAVLNAANAALGG